MSDVVSEGRPDERLASEQIAWLTTAGGDGQPQSSPVLFLWHDGALWMRSQADAGKIANIGGNPKVAIHLSDDGHGGDIVTLEGRAEVLDAWPGPVDGAYLAKYDEAIRRDLGTTPEAIERDYPAVVRITPTRARSW